MFERGQAPSEPVPGIALDPLPVTVVEDWAALIDQPLSANEEARLRQSFERQAPFGSELWKEPPPQNLWVGGDKN